MSSAASVSPIQIWKEASRPKTLPAAIAPVIIGTAFAHADRVPLHWLSFSCALFGAILIQIGTNFANDYFDFVKGTDTQERIGPTRATAAGLVPPHTMRNAFLLTFGLALLPGAYIIYRGGWPFVLVGLVSIACGVLYTGGPYPLGYLGLGDVFVLIFFGPVAVGGTYFLHALHLAPQSIGATPYDTLIAGLAPGLISVALLTVNNLRDVDQDRVGKKKTLAVRFGRGFARAEYLVCVLSACVAIPVYFAVVAHNLWLLIVPVLSILIALRPLRTVFSTTEGPALNAALAGTGKLLLAFSAAFSVCLIL